MEDRKFVRVHESGAIDTAIMPEDCSIFSLDFEGTGVDPYEKDYAARLCQVSFDGEYAFILNPEVHLAIMKQLVMDAELIIVHNRSYDLVVFDHLYGIALEFTWPKSADTQDMARLLYPTDSAVLNDLARKFIPGAQDSDKELKAEFKALKLTPIRTGYARIPLDNEIYIRYGGLDAIYTFKLWQIWRERVNKDLLRAEDALHFQSAAITRRGLLCDKIETRKQIAILNAGIRSASKRLDEIGIPIKVDTNEGREVIGEWLDYYGLDIAYSEKSVANFIAKTGQIPEGDDLYHCMKVGADDLRLMTMEADEFVRDVIADLIFIRQAEKIKVAYLEAFLKSSEVDGRVRPSIKTMAARTHRMSVSDPPLQQIPSHPIEVELTEQEWADLQAELREIENAND